MSCTYIAGITSGTEYVRCLLHDGIDYSDTVRSYNYIINIEPEVISVSLSPNPAYTADTIEGYCNVTDEEDA